MAAGSEAYSPLSYLEALETMLRDRYGGDEDFRLSDYFDLIGGTSTGAIIAALLAIGCCTAEIRATYRELGNRVFRKMLWRIGMFSPKFEAGPLREALEVHLREMTLGSQEIKTGRHRLQTLGQRQRLAHPQ